MNQVILPAADLKQALPGLSKVVSRKSTLPVLQTVRLTRTLEGVVTLSATDLDTFVSYNLEHSQAGEPFDVLLPFEQLNKTGRGSSAEVIVTQESKLKAKLRYQVAGSNLEQSVATVPVEEFPPCPQVTQPSIKMPENFGETLRQAFETSSTESSRHILQGAYLDVKEPKCHSIISTNGHCLFAANTFKFDLKEPVNLLRHKFLEWSGFLTGECEMAVKTDKSNTSWVKLTTPRWECVAKQIEGVYPNWRQVVPNDTETWTKIRLSEGAIKQMLNLSSKLPGDDVENRTLQLRVDKELHLEGKNKDDKEFTSAVIAEAKITGKPVTTALNREYLQTALRCGLDEIRIHTEFEPLLFMRPGKRLVVMPVRLNGPTPQPVPAKSTSQVPAQASPTPVEPAPAPAPTSPTTTPPQPATEAQTERNTEMTKETAKPEGTKPAEPVPSLIDQIDQIRETVKNVVRDLNTLTDAAKQLERDKRAGEKEVETARAVLKKLQQVSI